MRHLKPYRSATTPPGDSDHIGRVEDLCDPNHVSDVTSEDLCSTTTLPGDSDHIEDPCNTQVTIESHPEHQCGDDIVVLPAAQTLSSDSSPDILSADAAPPKKRSNEAAMLLDNLHQGVNMSRVLCSKSRNN